MRTLFSAATEQDRSDAPLQLQLLILDGGANTLVEAGVMGHARPVRRLTCSSIASLPDGGIRDSGAAGRDRGCAHDAAVEAHSWEGRRLVGAAGLPIGLLGGGPRDWTLVGADRAEVIGGVSSTAQAKVPRVL